jgi:hypothetical protein
MTKKCIAKFFFEQNQPFPRKFRYYHIAIKLKFKKSVAGYLAINIFFRYSDTVRLDYTGRKMGDLEIVFLSFQRIFPHFSYFL